MKFKRTCQDFEVDDVRIVATEATRKAKNSHEFMQRIEERTGWKVELLSKEEEGRLGAYGVASSFRAIHGLALDLGGGSIQFSWISSMSGSIYMSPAGSISLPYGTASIMAKLDAATTKKERSELKNQMTGDFKQAIHKINDTGYNMLDLYLSGGGFRRWGYSLMAKYPSYPIPIINGFSCERSFVESFYGKEKSDQSALLPEDGTFGISSKRITEFPAIHFLIATVLSLLPQISRLYFAQGGVREGIHFSSLPTQVQARYPLLVATEPYAPPSAPAIAKLLQSFMPKSWPDHAIPTNCDDIPYFLNPAINMPESILATALANLFTYHASCPKEVRAAAALRSTTTGILVQSHGLSHEERATLAIALSARWGGELAPLDAKFHEDLIHLAKSPYGTSWWATYIGVVAREVADVYPAGIIRAGEERILRVKTEWVDGGLVRKGFQIKIEVKEGEKVDWSRLQKMGKTKNRIGDCGWKVDVEVVVREDDEMGAAVELHRESGTT